jgi:hypoxanthine phosphoribosyltransferase
MKGVRPHYDAEKIAVRVRELAAEIAGSDLDHQPFLLVPILKGAFVFGADLIRELDRLGVHPEVDFVKLSSYGSGTTSSRDVKAVGDWPEKISGRRILIVDDIIDTGHSLAYARKEFLDRGAADVRICVLLDKPSRREVDLKPDFIGFEVENLFFVGYGLDYAEEYRGLPYVGTLEQS